MQTPDHCSQGLCELAPAHLSNLILPPLSSYKVLATLAFSVPQVCLVGVHLSELVHAVPSA